MASTSETYADSAAEEALRIPLALLTAASTHDLPTLKTLTKSHPALASAASTEYGQSALHLAVIAVEDIAPRLSTPQDNSNSKADWDKAANTAVECVKLLLQSGAVWNELDVDGKTPGCVAWDMMEERKKRTITDGKEKERVDKEVEILDRVYQAIVEAGVRAEVLLARLEGLGGIAAAEEDDEEEGEEGQNEKDEKKDDEAVATESAESKEPEAKKAKLAHPSTSDTIDVNSPDYLASSLTYTTNPTQTTLLDSDSNGVMMSWETSIMTLSASALLPPSPSPSPKRVLNVGFGLGIIDTHFETLLPANSHHIISEAHPDVLRHLRSTGWYDKPGVTIIAGRWQDNIDALISAAYDAGGEGYDAVYFDTFAESYSALKMFFEEVVVGALGPKGRFGFFHGLGADRRVAWDVYTKVVEMDLWDAGLSVEWRDVEVEEVSKGETWKGVRRRYWDVGGVYRLPVCRFLGAGEEEGEDEGGDGEEEADGGKEGEDGKQ